MDISMAGEVRGQGIGVIIPSGSGLGITCGRGQESSSHSCAWMSSFKRRERGKGADIRRLKKDSHFVFVYN